MMSVQKFAFAALAAAGLAGPVRADLSLTLSQEGGGPSTTGTTPTTDLTTFDGSGDTVVSPGGYQFVPNGLTNSDIVQATASAGGGETVKLGLALRKGTTTSGFTVTPSGSPVFDFNIAYTATAADIAAGFAPGTINIAGSFDATNVPLNPPGPFGKRVAFISVTETLTPDGNGGFTAGNPVLSAFGSPNTAPVVFGPVTPTFTPAAAALPEPAGVLAGLLGLPCAGGVLAMARRRLTAVVA